LPFEVNEYTLVPRPETELLVELGINIPPLKKGVAELARRGDFIIADLGTGSGAIAIAIAHERPHWQCLAADRSPEALAVAKRNAARFELSNLSFYQGNWCQAFPAGTQCDAIISNPPYIAEHDPHLQEDGVSYEPITALVSGEDGLDDIRDIALQARSYLKPGGWLLLEHGHDQGARVSNILHAAGYTQIKTHQDLAGLDRVTVGQYLSNQDVVYSPA
jgi:release factor glutamine methyltransferase